MGCGAADPGRGAETLSGGTTPGSSSDATGSSEGSTGEPGSSSSTDESSSGSGSESSGGPPFTCDAAVADSPVLDGIVLFDPAQPHPGDTLTVIVRATNGLARPDAPSMALEVTDAGGVLEHASQTVEGGEAIYYYAIPDVELGDVCVLGLVDGQPEVAGKVTVTPRPADPPIDGGIFKIVANHQWTCDEQPSNGNELHVWVRDENGQGIGGQTVSFSLVDSVDTGSIYNDDGERWPLQIVTGDDGHAQAFNYWPISDNGLLVLRVAVAGVASDIATEITTGWWEDDLMGCSYCGTATVNVWGHWSYTIEFQRDPTATEICVVENDHAGMAACGEPRHVHHHPDVQACWAAQ